MDVVTLVGALAALFIVIGLSEPLADRTRLPYTVVLALIGSAALWLVGNGTAGRLFPAAQGLFEFPIRANVFLYVLLPTLLFQVALGLNLRRMADDWVPILVMAVLAVVVATFVIGLALTPFTTLPLVACLLIGAIVSTTDPSAVVSIFRNIAAPERLTRIVEGESLLNDAAAIALFGFFLTFVMMGVPNPTLRDALMEFPWLIFGGIALGWGMARLAVGVLSLLARFPRAQVSLSVALPYVTFILAERTLGTSGVIAVVVAGMEEREYDILFADGLIGRELHTTLKQDLAARRRRAEARPTLDLAVQKTELVRRFLLFADMDEAARARLARALKARYVQPGEVLMRKDTPPREVCFIASGAVEAETAGQKHRLGRGDAPRPAGRGPAPRYAPSAPRADAPVRRRTGNWGAQARSRRAAERHRSRGPKLGGAWHALRRRDCNAPGRRGGAWPAAAGAFRCARGRPRLGGLGSFGGHRPCGGRRAGGARPSRPATGGAVARGRAGGRALRALVER